MLLALLLALTLTGALAPSAALAWHGGHLAGEPSVFPRPVDPWKHWPPPHLRRDFDVFVHPFPDKGLLHPDRHVVPPSGVVVVPPGFVWVPGHWAWTGAGWVWVPGHWTR